MRNFREMTIWNEGISLAVQIYEATKQFPKEEEYGLKSQIRRASVSVPSNIAEGCSRSSQKEFKRLSFISDKEVMSLLDNGHLLQRRINALIGKVSTF